jgi:hypothetical protein
MQVVLSVPPLHVSGFAIALQVPLHLTDAIPGVALHVPEHWPLQLPLHIPEAVAEQVPLH